MFDAPRAIFVYGSLCRSELAHRQVEPCISGVERAELAGYGLYVRDGLPFITEVPGGSVRGDLLMPTAERADALRRRVQEYEGNDLYIERRVRAKAETGGEVDAWVYIGRSPRRGNPQLQEQRWSSADDPLFNGGLDGIFGFAKRHFETVRPMPADMEGFWEAFLPIQGLYLTLCTVLERYTALVFGPRLEPGKRLSRLQAESATMAAVAEVNPPSIEVRDSRDPRERECAPGRSSFDAWYQVRSNLSHRGKAAFTDFVLVERSIVGLHDTLRHLLASQLPLTHTARRSFAGDDRMLRPIYWQSRGPERV
ncbi:gamma-glutamylcyclotransferase family protein [Micromonospora halotolerans]|uniref:Gamma-glutamylcyclotransferase family protein n=1 Tax=Micromonospora halotolerans TaxID=709879 RepID=A0ABY9ZVG2_9ACTN|nr:gamma-glutamylcyclotransferase family protein [Micromonospora halotolerans]WNM39143.1 gamma-glutamylcyclotransferase family protein [Micromonospora halotolerans]